MRYQTFSEFLQEVEREDQMKHKRREMARLYRAGYDARRISVALGCSLRCVYRNLTLAL